MVEMADVARAEYAFASHEHAELLAGLEQIHVAAEVVGRASPVDALVWIRRVRNWTVGTLEPHAVWEESTIYREIDEITGTTWSTKLMRFEHYQIGRTALLLDEDIATFERGVPAHEQRFEIYAHLIALETLVRAHIEREEAFLLPLVDGTGQGHLPTH